VLEGTPLNTNCLLRGGFSVSWVPQAELTRAEDPNSYAQNALIFGASIFDRS